jgi:hypothetical protein
MTTRRERRVVVAVTVVLLIAVVVALALGVRGGSSRAEAGCIDVTVPSTMGGATVHTCGPTAARWCLSHEARTGPAAGAAAAECRRAGYR